MIKSFNIESLADAEAAFPGFGKVWQAIKAKTNTTQKLPGMLVVDTEPSPDFPSGEGRLRLVVNLTTFEATTQDPHGFDTIFPKKGYVFFDCRWFDPLRFFHVRIQVKPSS